MNGGKKSSESSNPQLRQLSTTRALQQIGTLSVHGFVWYFFIYGEKNDVSGYVIFNATLLDFTVK